MNEVDPSTFCTVEFFEHELQTTPIVKGQKPEYNFTSQYVIRVDDFFLHYLQKEKATIELHQAIGSDYETRAACQLSFYDLIDKQTSRIHGSARLTCVQSSNVGAVFGTVEYWARLIVPVDEAFRLYKERTKALGYLVTNIKATSENEKKSDSRKMKPIDNMNELNINVLRCSKISSLNGKSQPSVYCVYKFYDFPDHDTEIISSSNYPEFNDHRSFAVTVDMDLDKYLKNYSLEIYVFDDNEPEDAGLYLGVAKIPLIGLAHDKDIKGTFEIKKV
jgi:protein fantom